MKAGGKEELEAVRKLYLNCFENNKERMYLGIYARILLDAGENPFPPCIDWLKKSNFDEESVSEMESMLFAGREEMRNHLIEMLKKETDDEKAIDYITLLLISQCQDALEAVSEYRATVTSEKLKERIDSLVRKYAGKGE